MTDLDDVDNVEATGTKEKVFNLNTFLKTNDQNCETVAAVWEAKNTVRSQKTQITRGIKELEEIFKNLDREMKTPPLNPPMIKKWKDIFLSKKDSLNNPLLGLMQHLNKYNETPHQLVRQHGCG